MYHDVEKSAINTLNQRELEQHCTILGWIDIVGHAVFLVVGLFVFVLLTGIGAAVAGQDPVAPRILSYFTASGDPPE